MEDFGRTATAVTCSSLLISFVTLALSAPGGHGQTYLYYYSSQSSEGGSVDGPRRTGTDSSDSPVLPGLYAAEIDHRRRITIPPDNGDKRPSYIEIGRPVRVHTPADNQRRPVCKGGKSRIGSTPDRRPVSVATKSMSFDQVTGRVVLHTRRRPEDASFGLSSVGACPEPVVDSADVRSDGGEEGEGGECTDKAAATGNVKQRNDAVAKIFDDAQVQPSKYKITSFAAHDGVIYFLLEHVDRVESHSKSSTIELRRLRHRSRTAAARASASADDDLRDQHVTSADDDDDDDDETIRHAGAADRCAQLFNATVTRESYFDVIECSEKLSVVSRETFQRFPSYQPFEGLLVLPATDGGGLNIYLQLQRLTYDTSYKNLSAIDVILYHVHIPADDAEYSSQRSRVEIVTEQETADGAADNVAYSHEGGSSEAHLARPIHTTSLESSDHIRYVLYQRGALSSRGDTLCWSAINRVLCGQLTGSGSVSAVRTVLEPGLVATVCRGTDVLASVVSGIALVDNADLRNLAFYFGCVAETPGMGGAGLFVGGTNVPSTVYRLHSNATDVQAETMFISTSSRTCPLAVAKAPAFPVQSSVSTDHVSSRWSSLLPVLACSLFLLSYVL